MNSRTSSLDQLKPRALCAALALVLPIAAHASGEIVEFSSASSANAEGNAAAAYPSPPNVSCHSGINAYGGSLSVNFATADGTAIAGSDYTATNGSLSFSAGECNGLGTTKPVPLNILGDLVVESDETFTVTLSGLSSTIVANAPPAALGANTVHTVTLTNDDSANNLSIGNVTQAESNGASSVNVPVTCSGTNAYGGSITVNFATSDGTATAGSDYTAASGQLSFTSLECFNNTTKNVTVPLLGDSTVEPDESFIVTLSGASGATITTAVGTVTLGNDDFAHSPVPGLGTTGLGLLATLIGILGAFFVRAKRAVVVPK